MAETATTTATPLQFETAAPEAAGAASVLSGGEPAGGLPLAPASPRAPALTPPIAPAEHTRVGEIFHDVLHTLSGGQTEPSIDAEGKITEQPVHRTGGEWARRLLAGALTGMASGARAPVRPGGAAAAGLGAGFEGEREALTAQDAEKRAQLQQNFKNQQAKQAADQASAAAADESLRRKAQIAKLTTDNAVSGLALARMKAEATDQSIAAFNASEEILSGPGVEDKGIFPDMKAVLAYRQQHPEMIQQMAGQGGGQLVAMPALQPDEEGNLIHVGIHVALVPENVMNMSVQQFFGDRPVPPVYSQTPGKMRVDGTMEPPTWQEHQVPPTTLMKDFVPWNARTADQASRENEAWVTEQEKVAQTKKAQAEAANPGGGKEDARLDKSYQFNSTQLEKERAPVTALMGKIGAALNNLNFQSPQADALLAPQVLSISAGGTGSGLRMNEAEISRIVGGATKWTQLQTAVNKWSADPTHATFTPDQRKQMADILGAAQTKGLQKQQILEWADRQLVDAETVDQHRRAMAAARQMLDAVDQGKTVERNRKTGELRIATEQ